MYKQKNACKGRINKNEGGKESGRAHNKAERQVCERHDMPLRLMEWMLFPLTLLFALSICRLKG